jgi:hypothetical protein
MSGSNIIVGRLGHKLPKILRGRPCAAAVAASFGEIEPFRVFVNLGFDHSVRDDVGRTMGQFACAGGSFAVIRELDNLGFDWALANARDTWSIPHYAAEYAAAFGHVDILRWLWIKGALPLDDDDLPGSLEERDALFSWIRPRGVSHDCCMLLAAANSGHFDVMRFLIEEFGVRLKWGGQRTLGLTALHLACRGGHDAVVAVLLKWGVDATIRYWGRLAGACCWLTPLCEAARSGATQCVRMLGEVAVGDDDPGAIVLAAEAGHADIVRHLLGRWPNANTDHAFSVAVVCDNVQVARMLSHRSKFVWGPRSWCALWRQPDERVVRLLSEHPFGEEGRLEINGCCVGPFRVPWSRLDLLLQI